MTFSDRFTKLRERMPADADVRRGIAAAICDGCGTTVVIICAGQIPAPPKLDGWVETMAGDFCPRCAVRTESN